MCRTKQGRSSEDIKQTANRGRPQFPKADQAPILHPTGKGKGVYRQKPRHDTQSASARLRVHIAVTGHSVMLPNFRERERPRRCLPRGKALKGRALTLFCLLLSTLYVVYFVVQLSTTEEVPEVEDDVRPVVVKVAQDTEPVKTNVVQPQAPEKKGARDPSMYLPSMP